MLAGVLPAGARTEGWETCSEVLLAVPCAGPLGDQRVPCRGPGGPVVNELICDQSGVGQASALQGVLEVGLNLVDKTVL